MADEYDLRSIALPAISTGVFGYPLAEAAHVMLRAAVDYVESGTALERIVFCLYGRSTLDTFAGELEAQTGRLDEVPR
jgi:O-acetyl-ADP-ribose deacetylase (regulator of RNase III)